MQTIHYSWLNFTKQYCCINFISLNINYKVYNIQQILIASTYSLIEWALVTITLCIRQYVCVIDFSQRKTNTNHDMRGKLSKDHRKI